MTLEAANRLLKQLEEPPHKVVFILVTANKEQVLPTIQSRCQIMQFTKVSRDALREYLLHKDGGVPDSFDAVYALTQGKVGQALLLLSDPDALESQLYDQQMLQSYITKHTPESIAWLQDNLQKASSYNARKQIHLTMHTLLHQWLHAILTTPDAIDVTLEYAELQRLYTLSIRQLRAMPYNPDIKSMVYALAL